MSKIVTAMNAMISNPDLITDVTQGAMESEIFFKYDSKYIWSLIVDDTSGTYILHYYPYAKSVSSIASIPEDRWPEADITSVFYNSKVLGTKEALDTFKELHSILNEKVYGMDDVLNDIIGQGQF
ncbi:hypothetical protein [Methylophaga thalassica]|uniref:hypothetical protein n=1 Tax=Methylophaga aminisulfidivorans TaxID=230105 RepID=UPI003A8D4AE8